MCPFDDVVMSSLIHKRQWWIDRPLILFWLTRYYGIKLLYKLLKNPCFSNQDTPQRLRFCEEFRITRNVHPVARIAVVILFVSVCTVKQNIRDMAHGFTNIESNRNMSTYYGSLLVTWYKNIFPQEIFFFPQEIFFSARNIFFSARNKFFSARNKFFSARNIFFSAENIFSARNIFFRKKYFSPQEIYFSPQEIFFFRKKYFFPQEIFFSARNIFFSARNIFLRKKYFFRKRCTTCSVAQSVSLARASCWGGVWKTQRWISSITCALWGSLRRRFERWEMT